MGNILENLCKISVQRQDNHNDYYFYPSSEKLFKQEAYDDKLVIVKIFNSKKQLIDEFCINVTTKWKANISTQIRTTKRNGIDVSKKYNNSKIIAFPKRYQNRFNINDFFKNNKYWIYAAGEKSYKWNDFFAEGIMAIGWDYLGDLTKYSSEEEIADKIVQKEKPDKYPMNNRKANWEFANEMQIGDIVYVKQGLKDALIGRGVVQSDYIFDNSRSEYKSIRKVKWTHNGHYNVNFSELNIKQWNQKTLTDISENKYKDFCLKIEDIFMKNNQAQQNDEIPLNQILYGPPGAGKTFRTKEIVKNILSKNTIEKAEKTIKDVDASTPWWQAIALAMYKKDPHKSYKVAEIEDLIEDYVKLKNNKTVRNKIWEQLQKHTDFNSETVFATDRNKPFLFDKNMPDSTWNLTKQGISYIEDQLINTVITEQQDTETNKYFDFVTFHQSYSYEEFVEGIKPSTENGQIKYDNTNGIFKKMCIKANSDPTNNYILVIDEINRGNISKIFGELITLIEEDKRIIPNGANDADDKNLEIDEQSKDNNSIVLKLPYSQKLFGVPKNLYILGTMNTSDRSIASIDIALRRRFVFKEIMPDVNLIPNIDVFGINLQKIFTTLNERISVLLDRDHQIGHSYFMKLKDSSDYNSDFKRVWYDCVMPLLNEYFYGDWEKLCALLGDSQDEGKSFIKKLNNVKFANNYSCDEDETYDIVSESSINFEAAIKNAFKNI